MPGTVLDSRAHWDQNIVPAFQGLLEYWNCWGRGGQWGWGEMKTRGIRIHFDVCPRRKGELQPRMRLSFGVARLPVHAEPLASMEGSLNGVQ